MKTYFVTGAAGFIGSHLCETLLKRGDAVHGLDNLNDFYDPAIKERNIAILRKYEHFSFVKGSLLDADVRNECLRRTTYDAVFHIAAWAGVRPSIERPALYQRENIEGTVAMMESIRDLKSETHAAPKFIFASSSSVYGNNKKTPFHEDDPVDYPVSPYAATKKACELLAYTYHHLYGLRVTGLRFFTVYGPRQRPEMAIHKFAQLMHDGQSIPMYGDGTTARDYTYIDDIISGVLAAEANCSAYHVYNLGNSQTVSLAELIAKIGKVMGVEYSVDKKPMQPGDVNITFADIGRAERELGYSPKTTIDKGLEHFAKWFRETHS
jgi:UDP-glucuronate 4-epimerase